MSLAYEFAPIDVSIMTHPKAFAAGVEAMGLWLWGMAYAKQHRTGGRLHRAAVLGAWGGRRNIMHAKRLVESGLWTMRDDGDWDIHNFEAKAPGRQSSSAERMRRLRDRQRKSDGDGDVTSDGGDVTVTRHGVTKCSPSPSVSSDREPRDQDQGDAPPSWFSDGVVGTVLMQTGLATDNVGARWLAYRASRQRKTWAMNHGDAVGWLSEVLQAARRKGAESPVQNGGASARARKELT